MQLICLTGLLLVITTYIHVSDCNSTKHNYDQFPMERRQILLKNIVNKMNNLYLYSVHNAHLKNTSQIMNNIKNQLKLASKFTGSRGNKYVELVMDGIQSISASKNKLGKIETVNAIESNIQDPGNDLLTNTMEESYESSDELQVIKTTTVSADAEYGEDACDCDCIEEKLCLNISYLNTFSCYKDQSEISLAEVCDGENDCTDNSDEGHCREHANKKLSDTKRMIDEIKKILPKHCLEVQNSVDKVVMKTRKETVTRVLKKQLQILKSVEPVKLHTSKNEQLKRVKKILQIVSSVEAALEGALCIRDKYKIEISRKSGLQLNVNLDNHHNKKIWAPPLCMCNEQFCLQNSCMSACNDTCWQRYSLGRWVCKTVVGARSTVPIDLVCDGKIDCFDESDENGCAAGVTSDKFEATQIYNSVIDLLITKILYSTQVQKRINLQNAIKNLQVQSMNKEVDNAEIHRWRDVAFSGLLSIFDDVLVMADNILAVNEGYKSLKTVSQKLVEAMKRSKTGNERLIPSNECHCMGGKCLLAACAVACVRFCAVRDTITEYLCKGNSSARIPLQDICNGKKDCPEGDDEENCQTDVCRNHHLLVLRNKIQNYKHDRWGHALAEILESWKTKTISSIRVIEKAERLTRQGLKKLVAETLHDLTQTYATLPKLTRRSTDGTMPAFLELSRLVKDTLRECMI